MPCPPHLLWLDHSNYTWQRVQITLVMQFSPTPPHNHFIPLRSIYSQHPVLKHPQSMYLSYCHRPSFTAIQNHRQYYCLAQSHFYVFWRQMRTQNVLELMVASIACIQSPLCSQIFELTHFKTICLLFMCCNFPYILVTRLQHILSFLYVIS
jgi:hypothetical protein